MVLEACAAGAAKAVISRVAGSTASVLVARAQDKRALQKALREALARTDAKHGSLLGCYEVNARFFEHEGANELARVLLPGPGPDARRLARAHHRSLGIEHPDAAIRAARVLGRRGELPAAVSARLTEIAEDAYDWRVRARALTTAVRSGDITNELVMALVRRLGDDDNDVREAASSGLVCVARDQFWSATILNALLDAITDPALAMPDRHEHRPGHDYAYDPFGSSH